jgi:hypothetical protein
MAQFQILIYRDEAGTQNHPGVNGTVETHCLNTDNKMVLKKTQEVLIHWNGLAWVEDAVYLAGVSIPALKIINQCATTFAYIRQTQVDFKSLAACCKTQACPDPVGVGWVIPEATIGVTFSKQFSIPGDGPYVAQLLTKPGWMNLVLNGNIFTLYGEPDIADDDFIIEIEVRNCGGEIENVPNFTVNPYVVNP